MNCLKDTSIEATENFELAEILSGPIHILGNCVDRPRSKRYNFQSPQYSKEKHQYLQDIHSL